MSDQPESEHEKQERWRVDVRAFISALFKHWFWWLSATVGSGFTAFCAAWMQGLSGGGKVIPFWVFGTAAAGGLVVASFRAFCDQRRIAEQEIAKSAALKKAFTELTERNEAAQNSHIALLENQVQTLQAQLDDRAKRKSIKDSLAGFRITIQNLTGQIHDISFYQYHDEIRQNFERDYLQMQNSAYSFLNNRIGRSEATTFIDAERIPKVQSVPNHVPDAFKDIWAEKYFMLNRLKYGAEQLEKAEEKLDSKDFILPLDYTKDLV